jgi:hypothetical protein
MIAKRAFARIAIAALFVAPAAVAVSGPAAAAPPPSGSLSGGVGPLCSYHPGLREDRSPVPFRNSPGFTQIVGYGYSCDGIVPGQWTNNAPVTCNDGNTSWAWLYVTDNSRGIAGWISACDFQA